jgi:DNA repair exonuclease SbcCD ATPase subunit
MDSQEKNPWTSDSDSQMNATNLFGFSILGGVLAIAIGTFIENIWLNIAAPLGIMAYYAYVLNQDESDVLSIEQKADSVYYMGFIFTLVAMTASLVMLARGEGDMNIRSVVDNFGLALATTIFGLTIRIIWLQISSQSDRDNDLILKEKLKKMTTRLHEETERIVSSMTALSSQMNSISDPLQENFEKLTRAFDLSDKINNNLSELNASTEIISDNFQSLAGSIEALNPEFSKLNQNVEKAVKVPTTIHEDLARIGDSSKKLITDFTNLSDSAEGLNPQVSELSNKLELSIDYVKGSIRSLEEGLEPQVSELSTKLALSIDYVNDAIRSLEETIRTNKELLQTNKSFLEENIAHSQNLIIQIHSSLSESAESIKAGNKAIQENLEDSAKRIANTPEPVSQEQEIKRLNEAIDKLNTLAESKDSETKTD